MNSLQKAIVFILIGYLFFFISPVKAQGQEHKWMVMGVPQYLFQHGLRIEIDKQTPDSKNWWVFAPQYYINVSNLNDINHLYYPAYKQMHGFGLSVYRKSFISKKYSNQGIYVGGGLGYQHFNMLVSNGRWVEFNDNGVNFFRMENSDYHVYINKILTEGIIGYQREITDRLFADIFIGFGLRYSFYKQPAGSDIRFNDNSFDYGYTGTSFIAGFRLGVSL